MISVPGKIRFAALPLILLAGLSGCGKFFQDVTTTTTTTTTTACTECVYVGNTATPLLVGYSISTAGALTAEADVTLATDADALALNPKYPYLYAGSASGTLYSYTIASTGALTVANSGETLASGIAPVAMAVDPLGAYLYILNAGTSCTATDGTASTCFAISSAALDSATGGLSSTTLGTITITAEVSGALAQQIILSSDGTTLYASLGTGGIVVCSVATGTLTCNTPQFTNATSSYNGLAVDSTDTYVYVGISGTSGGLGVFTNASEVLTAVANSPFTTGDSTTHSEDAVALGATYVYVTNQSAGTITGYAVANLQAATSSAPTAISGSPFTSSTVTGADDTVGLVLDASGDFLISINRLGTPDLQLYTITSTTGALTATSTATTGGTVTGGPASIAATASGT